jgi:hypothetical protein
MSKKLLAFLLSELTTVRIICRKCSVVTEMPIDILIATKGGATQCPSCKNSFTFQSVQPIANFASAVAEMRQIGLAVDLEFTVEDKP